MSYMRNLKPAIYADNVAHYIGRTADDPMTLVTGTLDTGSDLIHLHNGRPRQRCVFDSDTSGTDIVIKYDFGATGLYGIDAVALLNHNLNASGAGVSIKTSNTDNYAMATSPVLSRRVGSYNAGDIDEDGSDIINLASQATTRYLWLIITPTGATFADDIQIGQVMLARKWIAPHGPDMGGTRGISFGGVTVAESRGGGKNAVAAWSSGSDADQPPYGAPFRNEGITSVVQRAEGRRSWEYTESLLDDDVVFPSNYAAAIGTGTSPTIIHMLSLLGGPRHPFVFTPNSTSSVVGDYMWGRLAQSEVVPEENSTSVLSVSLRIEEEF